MNYHRAAFMPKGNMGPLVVGTGKDMQIRPDLWEKWNSDACDADKWKHGRVSNSFMRNYDTIDWSKKH